jgi:hypothetical protein
LEGVVLLVDEVDEEVELVVLVVELLEGVVLLVDEVDEEVVLVALVEGGGGVVIV